MSFDALLHVIEEARVLPDRRDAAIERGSGLVGMLRRVAMDTCLDQHRARLGGEAAGRLVM